MKKIKYILICLLIILCITFICANVNLRANETSSNPYIEYSFHTQDNLIGEYNYKEIMLLIDKPGDGEYYEITYENISGIEPSRNYTSLEESYDTYLKYSVNISSSKVGNMKGNIIIKKCRYGNNGKEESIEKVPIELNFKEGFLPKIDSSIYQENEKQLIVGDEISLFLDYEHSSYDFNYSLLREEVLLNGDSVAVDKPLETLEQYRTITAMSEGASTLIYNIYYDNELVATTKAEFNVTNNTTMPQTEYELYDTYGIGNLVKYKLKYTNGYYKAKDNTLILDKGNIRNADSLVINVNSDFEKNIKEVKYVDRSQRSYVADVILGAMTYKPGTQTIRFYDTINNINLEKNITINNYNFVGNLYSNYNHGINNIQLSIDNFNIEYEYVNRNFDNSINSSNESVASIDNYEFYSHSSYNSLTFDLSTKSNGKSTIDFNAKFSFIDLNGEYDEDLGCYEYTTDWYQAVYGTSTFDISFSKEIKVSDYMLPEKILLDRNSVKAYVGMPISLQADIYPNVGIDVGMKWTSSNRDVATVDANGIIMPISQGVTTITVCSKYDSNIKNTCTVEVYNTDGPKVNVYNENNLCYYTNENLNDKSIYGYKTENIKVLIKDFNKEKEYKVKWTDLNNTNSIIIREYSSGNSAMVLNSQIIECSTFKEFLDTYIINFNIWDETDINTIDNISGIISVYEVNGENEQLIYNQNIYIKKNQSKNSYYSNKISYSKDKYNFSNIVVGDTLNFSNAELRLIEGNAEVTNEKYYSKLKFTKTGKVKFALDIKDYTGKIFSSYEYEINVKENLLNTSCHYPLNTKQYVGQKLSILFLSTNTLYSDVLSNYTINLIEDSNIYKSAVNEGGGSGGGIIRNYNERIGYKFAMPQYNKYSSLFAFYPGKQKVQIINNETNEKAFDTEINVVAPVISSNINNNQIICNNTKLKIEMLKDDNTPYSSELKFTPSVEILSGGDNISISNITEIKPSNSFEVSKMTANIIPIKSGKAKIKATYTIQWPDMQLNNMEIDKSVNEVYYTKAWHQKKYGTISYEKIIDINVEAPEYKKGDLDKNGYITANDAAVALDIYKNNNAIADDIRIGDLDGNNIINAQDAAMILDMYKNGK